MIVGTRHRPALRLGRSIFSLMSVVALLALACFPVFAHADDSSGVQYSDNLPSAEGENQPVHHTKRPPVAKAADNGGASAPAEKTDSPNSDGSTEGSSEGESSSAGGGVAANGNDKGDGTGQGSPAGSANKAPGSQVQHSSQNASVPASKSSDSSSSPLVPILIAILVLAAISVAVVMIRQRRQGGPPTTPATSQKAS
jgi:cobalamin biosynthesis Mg chelatase CobN